MRTIVILLLLANVTFFLYRWLDAAAVGETGRLAEQVQPDKIKLLTPQQVAALGPAKTAALAVVCVEWGPLTEVERTRALAELEPLALPVGSLSFSPDGTTLIVGGSKNSFMVGNRGGLQFWAVASRQASGTVPGDATDMVQIALSGNGSLLASGHSDGAISLWEAKTRRLLHRFRGSLVSSVMGLAFSPTEPLLAASDWAGNIVLYNTQKQQVVPPPLKAHSGRVISLAFSPDGRTLSVCRLAITEG